MSAVFDIETGSLPLPELKNILPAYDPASIGPHPGRFNEADVKLGNLKDQDKIREKIEAAKKKHEEAVEKYELDQQNGEANYWVGIQSRAAMSALTGQVVAIGYKSAKNSVIIGQGEKNHTELTILKDFWNRYSALRAETRHVIGFNITEFDIPFIVQRSFILGVDVPKSVFSQGKYLDSIFIDLRKVWGAGLWKAEGTLDAICKACRLGKKTEDVSGAEFAGLWLNPETREKARGYLANDIEMTWALADRLGVL